MIASVATTVRGTAPIRTGKAYSRQSVRAWSASSSDKSNVSSEASPSAPAGSEDIKVDAIPDAPDETWKEPFSAAQFFGSYLQLGVWVVVLSVAGYSGFQQVHWLVFHPLTSVASLKADEEQKRK